MDEITPIKQEKTDEVLQAYASQIIDLLDNLNPVEKYKIIDGLHSSLIDMLKEEGIIIQKEE